VDGKILEGAVTEQFKSVHTPQFLAETDADKIIPKKDVEFDAQVEEQLKALGYVQ
jgi:hypothetical protein